MASLNSIVNEALARLAVRHDQEFERMVEASMRGAPITYISANEAVETVSSYYIVDDLSVDPAVEGGDRGTTMTFKRYPNKPLREHRFDVLRAEGKKLGEINAILEAEGYSEVFGEGVMPAPTKSHQIVRENKGARKLIETI